jgi:hypothetical protein
MAIVGAMVGHYLGFFGITVYNPGFGGVSVITLTPPNPGTFHDKFQLALISEGIDVKTVYNYSR